MESLRLLTGLVEAARRVQDEATGAGLGPSSPSGPTVTRSWLDAFDDTVTSEPLRSASRQLFADTHYARAVEEAFKCLNNAVKQKSGLQFLDGDALMRKAFSANDPVLKLNDLRSQSKKDEQRGYMDIYAGAMSGIRNPRAHEHKLEDFPEVALELLAISNHLMRILQRATRTRRRSRKIP